MKTNYLQTTAELVPCIKIFLTNGQWPAQLSSTHKKIPEIELKIFSFIKMSCQASVRLYCDIITNWMFFTELAIPALKPAGTKRREISEGGR